MAVVRRPFATRVHDPPPIGRPPRTLPAVLGLEEAGLAEPSASIVRYSAVEESNCRAPIICPFGTASGSGDRREPMIHAAPKANRRRPTATAIASADRRRPRSGRSAPSDDVRSLDEPARDAGGCGARRRAPRRGASRVRARFPQSKPAGEVALEAMIGAVIPASRQAPAVVRQPRVQPASHVARERAEIASSRAGYRGCRQPPQGSTRGSGGARSRRAAGGQLLKSPLEPVPGRHRLRASCITYGTSSSAISSSRLVRRRWRAAAR